MPFPLETFAQMQIFFWVLIRISIILFLMPLFGAKGVPILWKAGLSFVLAMVITPVVPVPQSYPETTVDIILGIFSEILLGLILALSVKMLFASIQMAGQYMAFQMGFAMARAMDPMTGVQETVLSQFLYLFMILVFITIDGHHIFIKALAASFYRVPPLSFSLNPAIATTLIKVSAQMFPLALRLAAPILVALFLSNLCLGIIAKTVPQMNILMVGFPINISLGFIIFGLMLANLSPFFKDLTNRAGHLLFHLLNLM
ncbi:flagellar biosynthetic protein FliR [Thermodesulfobacteriota bacterium]